MRDSLKISNSGEEMSQVIDCFLRYVFLILCVVKLFLVTETINIHAIPLKYSFSNSNNHSFH